MDLLNCKKAFGSDGNFDKKPLVGTGLGEEEMNISPK